MKMETGSLGKRGPQSSQIKQKSDGTLTFTLSAIFNRKLASFLKHIWLPAQKNPLKIKNKEHNLSASGNPPNQFSTELL